jgi:hypothetical protein
MVGITTISYRSFENQSLLCGNIKTKFGYLNSLFFVVAAVLETTRIVGGGGSTTIQA